MTVTLRATTICQFLAWIVALWSEFGGIVPPRWRERAAVVAASASVALHWLSGVRNPDGTPAALPFVAEDLQVLGAAEAAYEAYRAQVGGKSLATGAAIPEWPRLPAAIQEAWRTAAGAARAVKES